MKVLTISWYLGIKKKEWTGVAQNTYLFGHCVCMLISATWIWQPTMQVCKFEIDLRVLVDDAE